MVGDIIVQIAGEEQNLNHWLTGQGWAFPTFYSSMTNDEIESAKALVEERSVEWIGGGVG